jgi:hypothetical protein
MLQDPCLQSLPPSSGSYQHPAEDERRLIWTSIARTKPATRRVPYSRQLILEPAHTPILSLRLCLKDGARHHKDILDTLQYTCAKFGTYDLFLRKHIATRLLSKGTISSRLGIYPKRVQRISHLDGYYPASRNYCALPSLCALQDLVHVEEVCRCAIISRISIPGSFMMLLCFKCTF